MAITQGEDIDTGAQPSFWDTLAAGAKWVWDNVIVPGAQWLWENREMVMETAGGAIASAVGLQQVLVGPVPLYIIEEETLSLEGRPTRYAIEDKDELADHVFNEPKKVRLKVLIGSPMGGYPRAGLDLGGPEILHGMLIRLQRDKTPVTYVSRMAVWPNMVITRYQPTLTPRHVNAYAAEIVLEQVQFGQAPGEPQAPAPEQLTNQGNATAQGSPPAKEEASLLMRIVEGIRSLFGK